MAGCGGLTSSRWRKGQAKRWLVVSGRCLKCRDAGLRCCRRLQHVVASIRQMGGRG